MALGTWLGVGPWHMAFKGMALVHHFQGSVSGGRGFM